MIRLSGMRAQLGLWHAGLMALTLLVLAVFTYALLIGMLNSRSDSDLERYADTTARQIAIKLSQSETRRAPTPLFLQNDIRSWGRYIQVVDPQGYAQERSDA